jgi:hypothetical protein
MKIILFSLSLVWLALVLFVDFALTRTIFSEIHNFFEAGRLAIALFKKFNFIECILAFSLVTLNSLLLKQKKTSTISLLLTFLLLGISLIGTYSLTPKIASITATWEYAESMGTLGDASQDIQNLHSQYHQYYIALDSLKIILLFFLIILMALSLFKKTR